jgi:hypothetical protein
VLGSGHGTKQEGQVTNELNAPGVQRAAAIQDGMVVAKCRSSTIS